MIRTMVTIPILAKEARLAPEFMSLTYDIPSLICVCAHVYELCVHRDIVSVQVLER